MVARSVRKSHSLTPGPKSAACRPLPVFDIKERGIDWITATCTTGPGLDRFLNLGVGLLDEERVAGCEIKPWRFEQFEGLNAGAIAYGSSRELSIIRMSGELARVNWKRVYDHATSVSRIDYQVTVERVPNVPALIKRIHRRAYIHARSRRKPPEVCIRDSNRTGPTVYLGTRKSAWLARFYDKAVESGLEHYVDCMRIEGQFNKAAAKSFAARITADGPSDEIATGLLSGLLERRGLSPPWSNKASLTFCCPRRRSDADRRLEWLRSQVRPSIHKLFDSGLRNEVLSALGIVDRDAID